MHEQKSRLDWPQIHRERRNKLRESLGACITLWLGQGMQPRNYADNPFYPFRQNSHFLYYTGLSEPDLCLLSFPETDYDVLFCNPVTLDDIVWAGSGHSGVDMAREAGIDTIEDMARLGKYIQKAKVQGLPIHYLPPYQSSTTLRISDLLGVTPEDVVKNAPMRLRVEVAKQRLIKSEAEILEIEDALGITDKMHRAAMAATHPGMREYEILSVIEAIAVAHNRRQAFPPIVTIHGETLHNHSYDGILAAGQLLVNDSGAESPRYYASDITRTFPVSGSFSSLQAEIYQVVLRTQMSAIGLVKPGIRFRDLHIEACKVLAEGLRDIGLMKGNPSDAVAEGAHALFLPHGLGHCMGLDAHDMEDLGEEIVGYTKGEKRSEQFGMKYLRFTRPLEVGFVITIEPGIYFIPTLMDRWKQERLHKDFINYKKVEEFRGFGGIRIEDNVYVTAEGGRVLGPGIPKTIPEVEEAVGNRCQI
jgi:Xaa-Pro aminopeptidase